MPPRALKPGTMSPRAPKPGTMPIRAPKPGTMPPCAPKLERLFQSLDISTVQEVIDLTNAFEVAGISEPEPASPRTKRHIGPKCRHHELHVEYPAYDLAVPGAISHLARPKDVAHREEPQLDYYHIRQGDMGCIVRLDTQKESAAASVPPFEHHDNFVSMINRLSNAPGISTLKLLCLEHQGALGYSLRIITTWVTATGRATEEQSYNCRAEEFSRCISALANVPWADMLDDLVNRASDHAYLLVRDRSMKHSYGAAQAEQETFLWNSEPIKSANHVLAGCTYLNTREEVDNNVQLNVLTLEACGHTVRLSNEYLLHVMTPEQCAAYRCPLCGVLAMDSAALHKVAIVDDIPGRHAYINKDHDWARMFASLQPSLKFRVRNLDLLDALRETLQWLQPPASTIHDSQCPNNAPETAMLFATFSKYLSNANGTLLVSPPKTAFLLAKIATAALRENVGVDETVKGFSYVPLGYGRFVKRWLKGAVALLAAKVEAQLTPSLMVDEMDGVQFGHQPEKDDNKIHKRKRGREGGRGRGRGRDRGRGRGRGK